MFFSRFGKKLPISDDAKDYAPGNIVTWVLSGGQTHIGIVTHKISGHSNRPLIVHNIGLGQVLEDCLFKYEITGHYYYEGR